MGEEKPDELYVCDGCHENIPTHRARVSCHTCPYYHLCANCFVIKQWAKPHHETHSTMVLKQSGFQVPLPSGFAARQIPPALPPRPTPAPKAEKKMSDLPTTDWSALTPLWNRMKAPMEKMVKKGTKSSAETATKSNEPPSISAAIPSDKGSNDGSPPSQNPSNGTAPSYPQPATWEPLSEGREPTPIFVALMSTIFSHLDPDHTGYLSPEVYAEFLELQGYELTGNTWKNALEKAEGDAKGVADLELGLYFGDLNISHTLAYRPTPSSPNNADGEPTSAAEDRIKDSMKFSANMPMLSRQGFIDLSAIEYLKDPSAGHRYLAKAISEYGIWKELGAMPRSVLPEIKDEELYEAEEEQKNVKKDIRPEVVHTTPPAELTFTPINVKGGQSKIEAISKGEEFNQTVVEKEKEKKDGQPKPEAESPIKVKGGQGKIEAVSKGEEFIQSVVEKEKENKQPKSEIESPIKVKGGQAKIEAISNREEFDEVGLENANSAQQPDKDVTLDAIESEVQDKNVRTTAAEVDGDSKGSTS